MLSQDIEGPCFGESFHMFKTFEASGGAVLQPQVGGYKVFSLGSAHIRTCLRLKARPPVWGLNPEIRIYTYCIPCMYPYGSLKSP